MNRLLTITFLFLTIGLTAQEPMRVTRSAAVDRNAPIYNIFVDANNNKWVGNSKGVFQVHTVDYASPLEKSADQGSLLRFPDGNFNLLWNTEVLFNQMKEESDELFEGPEDISSAFYDEVKKELWIGTKGIGVFRFDMSGDGTLIENITMDNSKLRTDMITAMYCDRPGSYWIGSEEGVLHNKGKKWKLYEQYVNIEAIDASDAGVWVFGEEYLWKIDAGGDWEEIELEESLSDGKIKDIAFDSKGRIWIASEVITRYNPELGSVEEFGAAEYFTSDFPSALAVDQEDAIWVGTEDKGLYLIEKATAMSISCILDKAPACDGSTNGELKVVISGGVEPYTYKWSGGLTGEQPKDVPPGTYTVTITDDRGKSKTSEITINDPKITVSLQQENPESGPGAGDGVAAVEISGGQGEYTYRWDNGETTRKAQKLGEGEHSLTVTDESGCSSSATVMISQQAAPLSAVIEQTTPVSCSGSATAKLAVKVTGGKGPFQYAWSDDSINGETPGNIAAGEYTLTITDSEGTDATAAVTVLEPKTVTGQITIDAPASTGNADGQATVNATGGTAPYSFQWDNGETNEQAKKLAPGTRSVTITDAAGCIGTASINIDENILPLSVVIEQTAEIKCQGQAEAALSTQIKGGKGPFQYAWSADGLTGEAPSSIAAGKYTLTITDSEGSNATAKVTIDEPKAVSAKISIDAPASTGNADGQATAKISGGAAPYTYQWDNGETSEQAQQLAPGTRSVTITDAVGCTATASIEIDENILPLSVAIEQTAEIKCQGQAGAALSTQVKGGKGPFQYAWSTDGLSGEAPNNITAGKYTLTITDSEGTNATAKVNIDEPKAVDAQISIDAPASTGNADGQATAKASGGTKPYTYQWDNGEAIEKAQKLAPGTRSVTITDAAGCTATASIEIDENILPLSVAIEQTAEIKCQGQAEAALSTQVKGGKGPFQYAWSADGLSGEAPNNITAGKYTLTITDSEGTNATAKVTIDEPKAVDVQISIDAPASTGNADGQATAKASGGTKPFTYQWDNGEAIEKAQKLAPGTHSVTITDAAGCTATASIEIDENILPLSVAIEQTAEIKCQGQAQAALSTQVKGGKGPFQYAWNAADLSGEAPSNLAAGEYMLTITDSEGTNATAKVTVQEPKTLEVTASVDAPASTGNADGQASVKASGGTTPYNFKWDNGEANEKAQKLAPGTRSVTITDAAGCTTTASIEIDENILPLSVAIEQTAEIKCQGQAQAALSTQVKGGKGPFQYAWNAADLSGEAPSNLAAGEYTLTITDSEGTNATAKVTVQEPKTLEATASVDAPASTGNADGQATVKVAGGTTPYNFKWDNGEANEKAQKLAPGTRSVTITDAAGCTATASIEIDENILPLSVAIEQTAEIKCQGQTQAALSTQIRGGKGPFQYAWSAAGLSGETPSGLAAGEYTLSITDAVGTVATANIKVSEPQTLVATIAENKRTSNADSKDGQAKLDIKGGTPPFQISWDNGETGEAAKELAIGNHGVTITDANGCSTNLEFETKKKILPQLTLSRLQKGQRIRMEQLFFEADSFRITTASIPVLDELYLFMTENTSVVIEVGGHTNNIPETDFCDYLSTERAKSVANYIVKKGIDPQRVFYKGYGKRKPIATNRTVDGRARNQRVEVKILSL